MFVDGVLKNIYFNFICFCEPYDFDNLRTKFHIQGFTKNDINDIYHKMLKRIGNFNNCYIIIKYESLTIPTRIIDLAYDGLLEIELNLYTAYFSNFYELINTHKVEYFEINSYKHNNLFEQFPSIDVATIYIK